MRISDWSSDVCSSDLVFETCCLWGLVDLSSRLIPRFPAGCPCALQYAHVYQCGCADNKVSPAARHRDGRRYSNLYWANREGKHAPLLPRRSEERRVGKECVSYGRAWW